MIRVRFAAPTNGNLYISGARVALANYLFIQRNNGRMLLRFDDIDRDRSQPSHVDQVIQDLRWFGIDWNTVVFQSDRSELYSSTIERLKRDKFLYPCFESKEELQAKHDYRRRRNQPTVYDRAMLSLTSKQRQDAEAGGKRPHWRFKLSGRTLEWKDLISGKKRAALPGISDPILVQADGNPTSMLASVVDDVDHGTTHVIRAEDSADNTAVQLELFDVLAGSRPPVQFAHLANLEGGFRNSFAERGIGNRALRALRADGVEPRAIAACMTTVGEQGPTSLTDMARHFELSSAIAKRFDVTQMLTLNRQILSKLDFASVVDRLPGGATEAFWLAVRDSLDLLKEARGWWDVVAGTIVPPILDRARDILLAAGVLLPAEPWDDSVWSTWIAAVERTTGLSQKALLEPIRLALTGEDSGPALSRLLPLIGRPRAASRLALAAA